MDREFLEKVLACKTADELRALLLTRRQLTDSELEQVSGGKVVSGNIGLFRPEDLNPLYRAIADEFGFAVAYDHFTATTGFKGMAGAADPAAGSDADRMGRVLNYYWKGQLRTDKTSKGF